MEKKRLGKSIADRLERFAEKLEGIKKLPELSETLTVRKVKLDLRPRPFAAEEIREIRNGLRLSQAVFAEFIGVSVSAVQDWEQGAESPSGPARRILEEIVRQPEIWSKRIRSLANAD